jgi:hypothetical protein
MSYGFRRGGDSEGMIGNSGNQVSIMPFFHKFVRVPYYKKRTITGKEERQCTLSVSNHATTGARSKRDMEGHQGL